MTTCSISCRLVVALVVLGSGSGVSMAQPDEQPLVANSNQTPAGQWANGRLTVRLEAAMGEWSPEEHDGPSLKVAAFREEGRSLSTPGPLLRVPEGTEIVATVTNRLDLPLTVHGLHSRPGDAKNVVVVPPGESRTVFFLAGARGTYFYWASRTGAETTSQRRREDGQLNGAFIVEPRDGTRWSPGDRILVITDWIAVDDDTVQPPRGRELFTFNGRSWPHTERFTYRAAEEIHWRIINAASSNHPLHLHGFYFRVDSVGDAEADTTYADDQRRMVVTELVRPGRTFTLTWTPERIGNWLFHCHVVPHTSPQQRYWRSAAASSGHAMHDHTQEGMAGLVVGVTILPTGTRVAAEAGPPPITRTIELRATEIPRFFGADPGMAFVIGKRGATARPTIPGPPLVLTRGESTAIRVVNQLSEPLAVHWHGMEVESYYDGVPGLSGSGRRLLAPIQPGGTFVARFAPPRAGTFIYHTHFDDLRQLSSGLYGPLIVLPPGETFHPDSDLVLVISRAGPGETPIWLNGSRSPAMGALRLGRTYRLRIINIVPENPPVDVRLTRGSDSVMWRPVAKDGADLPERQRTLKPARLTIAVGETYDFEVRPDATGDLTLEVVRPANRFPAEITPSGKAVELRAASGVVVTIPVGR
jgi:FtsP/CotA-like multicopper oxidase with cupredoxin domain